MSGIALGLSFLAGVLLHDSSVTWISILPIGLAAVLSVLLFPRRPDRLLIASCLTLVILGTFRAASGGANLTAITIPLNGVDRTIVATVDGVPRTTATRTEARLRLQSDTSKRFVASLPLLPVVSDGDLVEFSAPSNWKVVELNSVEVPISVTGDVYIPFINVVSSDASLTARTRNSIAGFTARAIERNVPEPAGSLTLGIMTGDDSGMTNATRASFRAAGLSHITAVSGWNVAIVAGLLALMLRRLAPAGGASAILAIVAIWAYAFLVGMEPSVTRAAGMATVFLLAHWRGRPGDLLTSLLLTTAVIVAITPAIRFDIGFQLSVAATLAIVLLLEVSDTRPWWHSAIAMPLVAQIAVAPLLLHHLGTYSLLAPIANLASAWLVEPVMFGGLITVAISWFHPLSSVFGIATWVPARLIVAIAEQTSNTKWSSGTTMTTSWSTTLLIYLGLLAAFFVWHRYREMTRFDDHSIAADGRG